MPSSITRNAQEKLARQRDSSKGLFNFLTTSVVVAGLVYSINSHCSNNLPLSNIVEDSVQRTEHSNLNNSSIIIIDGVSDSKINYEKHQSSYGVNDYPKSKSANYNSFNLTNLYSHGNSEKKQYLSMKNLKSKKTKLTNYQIEPLRYIPIEIQE